jgi:type IV pilus assembly protein PilY1
VVDLSETGERVNVDMKLVSGTLVVASNVPSDNPCVPGGHGWFNFLDYASGSAVTSAAGLVSERFELGQIVGFGIYRLENGDYYGQLRGGGGGDKTSGTPPCLDCKKEKVYVDPLPPKGKRISWREIAQ